MMTLQWVDPTGKKEPLRAKPGVYRDLQPFPGRQAGSADGHRGRKSGHLGLRPAAGRHDALDFRRRAYRYPTWSPDGQYVVFASFGKGIFQARADGASQPQALTESKATPDSVVLHAGWQAAGL